jgi:hypothetical protein
MPYRGRCFATLCALFFLRLLATSEAWAEEGATQPPPKLGSYERSGLDYALKVRELTIEESPQGKLLGRIVVVNLDVFGKAEGALRYLNFLHVTTREKVIRREVLLRPGDLWDSELILETQRRLKDPLFTSLVVVVPVESKEAARVDLLVVTRDIWSLRMNSAFEYFQGSLIGLQLSVAENNIFGLRKHGAFVFDMNQGSFTLGPQYVDKFLLGTRLQLTTRFNTIFSRETREFEGTSSGTSLSYPLWSFRQKWGGDVSMTHSNFISRSFLGSNLEPVDLENTPEEEALPRIFEVQSLRVTSRVRRSFGRGIKQNISFGHSLSVFRPDFIEGFEANAAEREAFAAQVFPRSERISALFARYRLFTPKFVMYRNLNSFDLTEDVRLGPDISVGISLALKPIGSENSFYQPDASASYVLDLAGDGFVRVATSASSRIQDGESVDNLSRSSIKIATPRVADTFRVVAQADLGLRLRERGNGRFRIGGTNGLRGYQILEFTGQKQLLTNFEVRSMPLKFLFARAGGLLFWDMGHAADRLEQLRMKHSVGFGLRTLVPQLQPIVFRFDWAFPLQGASAGFPGRISAGVAQVF